MIRSVLKIAENEKSRTVKDYFEIVNTFYQKKDRPGAKYCLTNTMTFHFVNGNFFIIKSFYGYLAISITLTITPRLIVEVINAYSITRLQDRLSYYIGTNYLLPIS